MIFGVAGRIRGQWLAWAWLASCVANAVAALLGYAWAHWLRVLQYMDFGWVRHLLFE
jgi:hypothetical protein